MCLCTGILLLNRMRFHIRLRLAMFARWYHFFAYLIIFPDSVYLFTILCVWFSVSLFIILFLCLPFCLSLARWHCLLAFALFFFVPYLRLFDSCSRCYGLFSLCFKFCFCYFHRAPFLCKNFFMECVFRWFDSRKCLLAVDIITVVVVPAAATASIAAGWCCCFCCCCYCKMALVFADSLCHVSRWPGEKKADENAKVNVCVKMVFFNLYLC